MTPFNVDINTIHCDMDGVLADFTGFVTAATGKEFSNYRRPKFDAELWKQLESVDRLFYQLPPTEYVKRLWDEIKLVDCSRKILTALPFNGNVPTALADKTDWVNSKHADLFGEQVQVNAGPYASEKWKHARPGDILIDDSEQNILQWVALGGGIGIYHHNHDIERTVWLLRHYTGQ